VLDHGTAQLSQFAYDTANFFKLTQAIDPVGRKTSFAYPNPSSTLRAKSDQTDADGIESRSCDSRFCSATVSVIYR